jgi:receptor protein-tyrosine kinase
VAIHIYPGNSSPDLEYTAAPPSVNGASNAGSGQWNLMEYVRTLYRRKTTLCCVAALGMLAAALISALQPRLYRSQASIQIQGINENFLNLRDVFPTAAPSADNAVYVQTQAEMLQQDSLLELVVEKLHLQDRPEYQGSAGFWSAPRRPAGESASASVRTAAEELKRNIQVAASRTSSIIRIVAQARDPHLAALLANTLAQTFIEQNIEARQRSAQQTYASLSRDLAEIRKKVLRSQAELGAYGRGASGILGLGGSRRPPVGSFRSDWISPYGEADGNRQFYEAMSRRVDEASLASTVRQSNIRLVGPAQPPSRPFKPNLPLNLIMGIFGGLMLGVGYVMLREQTNSALRAPGEAGAYLTLPELGAIPRAEKWRLQLPGLPSPQNGKLLVERASLEQPLSGVSESFRATLASILSAGHHGERPQVLVITSSRPNEGKTTVVSNLGIALAEIGNKVLLIDGDLRRPRLHQVFDQTNTWGLSDVLREKNAVEDLPLEALVKKTAIPRLNLMPSGTCTDNIFGLLCSGRMARLMPRFRQEYDYVLIDAPPCLEFADARIMARYAEKLLLVVRADFTDRRTAQAAVQRLLLDRIPVMGVIFNYWDPTHSDLYSYARYSQELA